MADDDSTRARKSHKYFYGTLVTAIVVGIVVAVILITSSSKKSKKPTAAQLQLAAENAYRKDLTSTLAPVVSINHDLATSLQHLNGAHMTIHAVMNNLRQAQATVLSVRDTVASRIGPASEADLQQQAQQALAQESAYLQGIGSAIHDPTGENGADLRVLAADTQSAFIAIAPVAPGGSASINGVDNFLEWVAGANGIAKADTPPKIIIQIHTTTATKTVTKTVTTKQP